MSGNTTIIIKKSTANGKPATLNVGELAYSYLSNTLFIGTPSGTNTLNIGGYFYTTTLDAATSANTASTLVKRDVNGAFQGTSNNATQLATPRNLSISGGDMTAATVAFDGSAAVVLNSSLNTVSGLSAGSYGSSGLVPVVTVAANGRVIAISTTAIAAGSTFSVQGNTGGVQVVNSGNTLALQAAVGSGLTTVSSANGNGATVTFGVDTTILRSNTAGNQTISSDLTLTGNVTILQSNIQSFNIQSTTIYTNDSMLQLASNNIVGDLIDIGFYGTSNTGSTVYHGLVREGSTGPVPGQFFLFKNLTTNPTGNTIVYASASRANLVANLVNGMVANLVSAIGIADGGTGATSFSASQKVIYDGSKLVSLANTTFTPTGSGAGNNTITSLTVDAYGRFTAATFTAISGLTVPQGGTGAATLAQSGMLYGNGTAAVGVTAIAGGSDQTFSNQLMTVNASNVPVWTTTLDGGLF